MNAVNGGSIQRSATTVATVSAAHAATTSSAARSSRRANPPRFVMPPDPPASRSGLVGLDLRAQYDDRFRRHVVVAAAPPGLDRGDRVDDVHSVGDAAKHRVTGAAAARVEKRVVDEVDEELRRRAVR